MIRPGFLDSELRQDLIELTRDGSAAHRLARRANALLLMDDGMSCELVAKVLPPKPLTRIQRTQSLDEMRAGSDAAQGGGAGKGEGHSRARAERRNSLTLYSITYKFCVVFRG